MADKEKDREKDKSETKAAAPAPRGKGKGRLFMIAGAVLALLLAGGGAWWFTRGDSGESEPVEKAAPALPPVFVALEPFTVNLQPEASGSQYMQVGITVKIAGQPMADRLKELMPEVRNRLLLTLSAKKASELLKPEGKTQLAKELAAEIAALLDPEAAKKNTAPAEPAITVAAAPAATGTDATEQNPDPAAEPAAEAGAPAEGETPAAAAAAPAKAAETATGPVLGVLFTSLIIQ